MAAMWARTSASQTSGSTSLSLAVAISVAMAAARAAPCAELSALWSVTTIVIIKIVSSLIRFVVEILREPKPRSTSDIVGNA